MKFTVLHEEHCNTSGHCWMRVRDDAGALHEVEGLEPALGFLSGFRFASDNGRRATLGEELALGQAYFEHAVPGYKGRFFIDRALVRVAYAPSPVGRAWQILKALFRRRT